jgi:DNA-binding NarL/FixJ family response regulator
MLAGGATTVGIATELYLSVETVRWHIKSILRKLGVRSRADAIACLEELQAV